MSALTSLRPSGDERPERSHRLASVPKPATAPISRVPFLVVLVAILGVGMAGLLLLNTTLQSQAFELSRLNTQVRDLSYAEAGLQASLDEQSSTRTLTRRASDIGMRPRDHTAFVSLPDGEITGEVRASGDDYPEAFLDRDPAAVREEQRDETAAQADKRVAAEEESRERRRETVRAEQAEEAKQQAERDSGGDDGETDGGGQ
ncbi:hypothetical protein ACF3NT_01845 [Naumannella halotolerans]|uniref:hypothetical protein n=1 Tax=Naumannella halotolerans TaxID=993414 RepID=UPI00370D033C